MAERIEPTEFKQRIFDSVPQIIAFDIEQREGIAALRGRIKTDTGLKTFTAEYLRELTREYADEIADVLTTELK